MNFLPFQDEMIFFNLNVCYFRANILDEQFSHVQGWKDLIFPAAEAVTVL